MLTVIVGFFRFTLTGRDENDRFDSHLKLEISYAYRRNELSLMIHT
jgi:hypothetical protein